MSSKSLIVAIAVLAMSIMPACSSRPGNTTSAQAAAPSIPVVAVSKAARTDLSSAIALTAEFTPYQEVDVMAKISGYVREINVDIGDRVKAGEVLATLEIPEMQDDLSRASAAIEEAGAELASAKDELQRAQSQHEMDHLSYSRILDVSKREKGLVPQQQVDEAHSRDLVAEAQVSAAKSRIAAFEQRIRVSQAEEARYKTMYQYAVITAPFSGVVTRRYANKGSLIQAGTSSQTQAMPLVRISENGRLRLDLPVPESAVPSVRLGQLVDVKISALNKTFPGRVSRFEDKLDESTRTMKTEVDVPNPSLTLVPGMYAEVDLVTGERKNVLSVPVEAIDGSGDAGRVFRVSPSGELQALNVRLGLENAQRIEIRDGNLQDGDEVVVGSRSGLKDGTKVQPREVNLNGATSSKL